MIPLESLTQIWFNNCFFYYWSFNVNETRRKSLESTENKETTIANSIQTTLRRAKSANPFLLHQNPILTDLEELGPSDIMRNNTRPSQESENKVIFVANSIEDELI